MQDALDGLVRRYEEGHCSRRELLNTLGMLVGLPGLTAAAVLPASPFRCRELNHITLRVRDLGRSRQFYSRLLGLPVLSEDKDSCRLSLGRGFLSLWQDSTAGFDHWCVGVESFTQARAGAADHTRDSVRDTLAREGYSIRRDEGDSTIYVRDPDENVIQLEAPGFKA